MPEAVRTVTRARTVLLPAIVLGELRVGFRLGTRRVENEERLRQFIEEPVQGLAGAGRRNPTTGFWSRLRVAEEDGIDYMMPYGNHCRCRA